MRSLNKLKPLCNITIIYMKNSPVLTSVICNTLYLLFILVFCSLRYETNDDSAMSQIAYGTVGYYSYHLVFISCIIGMLLEFLMIIAPLIPWYPVIMYILLFLAFMVISYCFIRKNYYKGICISLLFLIFYGYYVYTSLQFTEVAAVLTIAGVIGLFDLLCEEKMRISCLLIASILLLSGSMYRFNMFCGSMLVMSGYGFYWIYKRYKADDKKGIKKCIIIFSLMGICCLGAKLLDNSLYEMPGFKEYKEFNTYRSVLMDHGFPDYESNISVYERLNISEEDLALYKTWDFADTDIFTTDALKTLVDVKNETTKTNKLNLQGWVSWFPKELLKYDWLPCFLICIFLSLIINSKNIFWVIYEGFILSGIQFYFYYIDRYLQGRVDIGLFLSASVVVMLIAIETESAKEKRIMQAMPVTLLLIVLTLLPNYYADSINNKTNTEKKESDMELNNLFIEDKEHLYLKSVGSPAGNSAYGIWDVRPRGSGSNQTVLGGWKTNSPFNILVMNNYGVANPFKDMVNNQKVYLIDNTHINKIVDYIRRHYDQDASARLVKKINDCSIYRILSEAISIDISNCKTIPDNLQCNYGVKLDYNQLTIDGYSYIEGVSSYLGSAYAVLEDSNGNQTCYQMTQYESDEHEGDTEGQYSIFRLQQAVSADKEYTIRIYYEYGQDIYLVWESK